MNVLLIKPPSTILGHDPTIPAMTPPLGLCYLASYLEKHGHSPTIFDGHVALDEGCRQTDENKKLYGLADEEIREGIKESKAELIGVSCMYTAYAADAHRVAKIAKEVHPDVPVVMGGAHASSYPDLALSDKNVDIVAHGEGEATLVELVEHLESGKDLSESRGISLRKEEGLLYREVHKTPSMPKIEDLDSVPFPARHLLDMKYYLENSKSLYAMRSPSTTIITSRGCPQDCSFCSIQAVWGTKSWRERSSEDVVNEIEYLHKEYGIQEFHVLDDAMGTRRGRLIEICNEIVARGLDIKWTTPNGIAHWYLNEEALDAMKRSGCYRITYGLESANVDTRKMIGKPFQLSQAQQMIKHANKIGMWTVCTNIFGFHNETKEAIMDTIEFNCKSGVDMALFFLLCPFPGTQAYQEFKDVGLLNYDKYLAPENFTSDANMEELSVRLAGRGSRTIHFTAEELKGFLALAYRRFFLTKLKLIFNPVHMARKVRTWEDLQYTAHLVKIGIRSLLKSLFQRRFFCQDMRLPQNLGEKEQKPLLFQKP